ncbi:hypothetical protein NEOLI_005494 [Neolecta irregularis DAH-3]|uniref:Uncharacterized protein n=1 Tax=Neolecta irregularis (strain DAH-3) TaxID=1198029 RepID=A0A1U7LL20_NEOID|nr:hypothetical protein NEOLI_005494 [Neolecta irregularis DAH-3]|eukprot:OLL23355.1 hypothetical protein NEOLI_005494 [Neolecta irregularis DAH-3]
MKFSILLVVLPFVESAQTLYKLYSKREYNWSELSLFQNTNYHDAFWLADMGGTGDIFYFEGSSLVKYDKSKTSKKISAHIVGTPPTEAYFLFADSEQHDFSETIEIFHVVEIDGVGYLEVRGQQDFLECNGGFIYTIPELKNCDPTQIQARVYKE